MTPFGSEIPHARPNPEGLTGNPFAAARLASAGLTPQTELSRLDLRELYRLDAPKAEQLVRDYYPLYALAFPDPSERATEECLRERLQDPSSPLQVYIFLSGDKIVGGRHARVLHAGGVTFAVGDYIFVVEEYRKFGYGSRLRESVEKTMQKAGATFFLGEINDPRLMGEAELAYERQANADPALRVEFWRKQGYRQIDAPYAVPPLAGREVSPAALTCTIKFLEERAPSTISTSLYLAVLQRFFLSYSEPSATERALDWIRQALGSTSELRIIDLAEPRTLTGR